MPDTYVACAMSSLPHEEYEVFRHTILAVCDALRNRGRNPYSEPFEKTGADFDSPKDAIKKNINVLNSSTLFVLLYTTKEVSSTLIELGYALNREIPIIVFAKKGVKLPFYLRDVEAFHSPVQVIMFSELESLPSLVESSF